MAGRRLIYPRTLFDLQLRFARRARALAGVTLERALLDFTNFYVRFGCGRDFDAAHNRWQEYLAGLRSADDAGEWTWDFYRRDPEAATAPRVDAVFGCFSYALEEPARVRLHFRNADEGHSPLGRARAGRRREELESLANHLREAVDGDVPVVGASWLYNIEAYRRLFPTSYVASARPLRDKFRSMALWGQFVSHRGELKEPMTRPFLNALAEARSTTDLDGCFPFPVLLARATVSEFVERTGRDVSV